MTEELILHIGKRSLEVALLIAAPALIVATVVGLLTAMFQAVTSIKDMTAGMVMKLGAIGVTLLIFGAWMLQLAVQFTIEIFGYMKMAGS